MAANDGERRMVFDIRGRRKHVVKFVYAILALLMGASLFLVIGPFNIANLFGGSNAVNGAAKQFEEQATTLERKLKKDPEDEQLLLNLTRARINAGNSLAVSNPETGEVGYTPEGRQQLAEASEAWSKYLKASEEPSASGAQVAAGALFALSQTSRTGAEAEANVQAAARAQKIVAEQRPNLGSLSTLAIYLLYSFDYEGAKQAEKEALPYANTKFERENLGNELERIEKRARTFEAQLAKAEKEAKQAAKQGKQSAPSTLGESNPFAAP